MSFKSTRKNWEGLAKKDPFWAICTNPQKKNGKWDVDDFFRSGELEVDVIFSYLREQGFLPDIKDKILDFGCGLGRLSRALYPWFEEVYGIDVSNSMITKARELNKNYLDKLHFLHNEEFNLSLFGDGIFDMVITTIVLQHISYPENLEYVEEFIRVLKPGGILLFQVPVADRRKRSLVQKLKSRIKIRERLALAGIGNGFQMEMNTIPETELVELFNNRHLKILSILPTNHTDPRFDGALVFLDDKEEEQYGFISKLFIVKK